MHTFFNLWIFLAKNLLRAAAKLFLEFWRVSRSLMITEPDMVISDKLIVSTWAARAESEVTWDTGRALRASDERLEGCAVIYGSEGGGGRCAQHVVGPGPSELRGKLAEEYFPTRDRVAAARGWVAASTCRWRRAPAWRHA